MEPCADVTQRLGGMGAFVAGQVVQDDHVSFVQGRCKLGFNITPILDKVRGIHRHKML